MSTTWYIRIQPTHKLTKRGYDPSGQDIRPAGSVAEVMVQED